MIQDVYPGSRIRTFSHPGSHGQKKAMDPRPATSFLTWPKRSDVEQIKFFIKRVFQLSNCEELKFEGLGH
jgi:hypothetical protein